MKVQFVLAVALAATASIASAAVTDSAPCAKVSYSDLNLRSDAGAAAFRHRVDNAVVTISGGDEARTRPDVVAARQRARAQADAVIRAAG